MHASSISLIPPGTGGVRDYALTLGNSLDAPLLELTKNTDVTSLSGEFLFLHFSGYGFQKRGLPLWLVDKVRRLRARFKAVGVVFHELFATGPPWSSAFWLSACQQRIARDLLLLADFWLTNREESARWLREYSKATPYRVLPVFSNVGEPQAVSDNRQQKLVVFGSAGVRSNVYEWGDGEVFRCAKRMNLEIHDIGPALPEGPLAQKLAHEGVLTHGRLPAEEVSALLATARFGALAYPVDYVSKSGVLAAYCAHGVCPILLSREYATHDGLISGTHYVPGFKSIEQSSLDPAAVGLEAHNWYRPHRVDAHVAALQEMSAETRR